MKRKGARKLAIPSQITCKATNDNLVVLGCIDGELLSSSYARIFMSHFLGIRNFVRADPRSKMAGSKSDYELHYFIIWNTKCSLLASRNLISNRSFVV